MDAPPKPAMHKQVVEPTPCVVDPAGHVVQLEAADEEYIPLPQGAQELLFMALAYEPALHAAKGKKKL